MHRIASLFFCISCFTIFADLVFAAEHEEETATVKLIDRVGPAVVPIFVQTGERSLGMGTGAVIHPAGFIITADHVSAAYDGVVLFGLERVPFKAVARLPDKDLAVLKVDPAHITSVLPLASNRELKAGEPIILAGNPSGRGIIYSQGIISAPAIDPTWPTILTRTYWRTQAVEDEIKALHSPGGRPVYLQFDAGSNRGNSGGPLIGYDGRLVGIASAKSPDEEAINWAIPCERIKVLAPWLLQPEIQEDIWTGISIDTLADSAIVTDVTDVTDVTADSPAWLAGIRAGDCLISVNEQPVATGIDWLLSLYDHKADDELKVTYTRNSTSVSVPIKLTKYNVAKTAQADGLDKGLHYAIYAEAPEALPDFSRLQPVKQGHVAGATLDGIPHKSMKELTLTLAGFADFPEAGLYRMHLSSDDSSKLYIDGRLAINNDLTHPMQEASAWIRVAKGLTPIRIEYGDKGGQRELELVVSRDVDSKQLVELTFYQPQAK
jgi:S1-C subfamily serine protease